MLLLHVAMLLLLTRLSITYVQGERDCCTPTRCPRQHAQRCSRQKAARPQRVACLAAPPHHRAMPSPDPEEGVVGRTVWGQVWRRVGGEDKGGRETERRGGRGNPKLRFIYGKRESKPTGSFGLALAGLIVVRLRKLIYEGKQLMTTTSKSGFFCLPP